MTLDALELELRRLPGVRAAGFQERDDLLLVQLQIGAEGTEPNLALQASQIATRHSEKRVAVELVRWRTLKAPTPPSGPDLESELAAPRAPAPVATASAPAVEVAPEPEPEIEPKPAVVEPTPPVSTFVPAAVIAKASVAAASPESDDAADVETNVEAEAPVTETAAPETPAAESAVDQPTAAVEPEVAPAAVQDAAPEFTPRGRVRLLTVLSFPDTDELEVHLTLGEQRTIGRSVASRGLLGAVEATIDAVSEFIDGPSFTPAWTRTLETGSHQYLVVIGLDGANDVGRYGIAGGDSPLEAAARATLHALNRTVEGQTPNVDADSAPASV
jgi:hypothetical protein